MLTPEQVFIIGLVASLATQLFKFVAEKFGWVPGQEVKIVILFVFSVALAAFFGLPSLPPIGDPLEFAKVLLEQASAVIGVATLVYKLLAEKLIFPAVRLG